MRMCAALGRAGHEVELICKDSSETTATGLDDFAFYGVEPTFKIRKLARPRARGGGLLLSAELTRVLLARRGSVDLVFGRDPMGALLAAELRMPLIIEWHELPRPFLQRWMLHRLAHHSSVRGLISISEALRVDLAEANMLPKLRPVIVAHDAADLPGKPAARAGARSERPRIGYVGSLYEGRGIDLIVELATRMPEIDVALVGGTVADQERWRARGLPANLELVGFVPPAQLAAQYSSFDVLLLPHPKTNVAAATGGDISKWTSPLKMFEYMASNVPIIASDLPVLGEVLHDGRNALIAPAGQVDAWIAAIRRLCADRPLGTALAACALEDLRRDYTWDARVRKILGKLKLPN
jgi:glycosyltransferase involved in cell wall biosynthesis